jgi:hypothetical protein
MPCQGRDVPRCSSLVIHLHNVSSVCQQELDRLRLVFLRRQVEWGATVIIREVDAGPTPEKSLYALQKTDAGGNMEGGSSSFPDHVG